MVVLRGHGLHVEGVRAGEEGVREREDGRAARGQVREPIILYPSYTLYTPFIHLHYHIYTYVHPSYTYIHHIAIPITPLNTLCAP